MPANETRTALATTFLLVAALGAVAAPAAAADGGTEVGVGVATGEGLNSTLDATTEMDTARGGGSGSVDCEGQPTHHQCDKGGEFDGGPVSADYEGDTYSDDDDVRFGGGDEVTLSAPGERATFGFDCAFDAQPSRDDCAFDVTSSGGGFPASRLLRFAGPLRGAAHGIAGSTSSS